MAMTVAIAGTQARAEPKSHGLWSKSGHGPEGGGTTVLEFANGSVWEPFHTCTGADSMPVAWFNRPENMTYFMAADHRHMYAGVAPTLQRAPAACSGRVMASHDAHGYDSGPQSYANFQWLQSVRVFADGTAAALVHNEFKGEFAPLGEYCSRHCADGSPVNASGCRDVICEIWSTGLATSSDGGATFSLAAPPPAHLVAALPHEFSFDQPISGYGAISPALRGDDGAFYGSINVVNRCTNGSAACGHTAAGNCLWRATDFRDPGTFRARDSAGNFTLPWASAYAPGGERFTPCATLPVTADGPFGSHVVFRRVVRPTLQAAGGAAQPSTAPTFIALGDVAPYNGRVKYSLSYEPDFAEAMRDVAGSWTAPRYLNLDGVGGYFYPTLIDVRSPELGVAGGTEASQEDGDSFALVSYPHRVPPRPGGVVAVRVAGAGSGHCNGEYRKAPVPPGFPSVSQLFRLDGDGNHSVYENDGAWHIAQLGTRVWYSSADPSPAAGGPPATGWAVTAGEAGALPAPRSVTSIRGANVTSSSSLHLYLRGPQGTMRRTVQLRDLTG